MARIQYDEDDNDDTDQREAPQWRRRLVIWVLAAVGLGLGFLIPYTLYLNHEVGERFGQLKWQIPTRVYARPLELAPGLTLDAATLKIEKTGQVIQLKPLGEVKPVVDAGGIFNFARQSGMIGASPA